MNLSEISHLGKLINLMSGEVVMIHQTDDVQIAFGCCSGLFYIVLNGSWFPMSRISDVKKADALAMAIRGHNE